MPTEIKYGVVVDNKDIHETGKVRILLFEQDLPAAYRNKNIVELKKLLNNLDAAGNHIPWQKSTATKVADPYLADPFLPKQINLIPEEGQLVKVIIYGEALYREYVGPQISSLENQKEGYVNAQNSFRTAAKKDLIKNGYVNKVSDFTLYGDNSQMILGDKELFLRTHPQEYQGKKKSTDLSLFQQSTFNSTLTIDKTKKNVVVEPEKLVSHLVEVSVVKKFREFLNDKTVVADIKVMSVLQLKNPNGKVGMTNRTYISDKVYDDAEVEFSIKLETDDIKEVEKYVDELRMNLLNKKMPRLAGLQRGVNRFETGAYVLTIADNRQMTRNFTEITDRTELDVLSFIIRPNPTHSFYQNLPETLSLLGVSPDFKTTNPKFYAKELANLSGINNLINDLAENPTVMSRLMNEGPRVITKEDPRFNLEQRKDSYSIQASKKILLLSTQVTPNLISSNPTQYGLTQQEIANLVDVKKKNTYSVVRGEMLIQTLIRLVDLMLAHGHATGNTVKNSLEEDTRAELTKLKEELVKGVNSDLSGGPALLNQYIRIN